MAEVRIRELGSVPRAGYRSQGALGAFSAAALERELGRTGTLDQAEPVEHLGDEREVRSKPPQVRVVVVRHERFDTPKDLLDRRALDGHDTGADQRPVHGVDDMEPVAELVQAQRVEVQVALVARIRREEARVPVARAEEREDPEDPDQELVPRELGCRSGERVHLRPEALPRHASKRRGMDLLDLCGEKPHVGRSVRGGG